jgi:flagellar motility protein MotE (MotC chaperone)
MSKSQLLIQLVQTYVQHDPATAARSLEAMGAEDAAEVLKLLPPTAIAGAFPHLQDTYAAALLVQADSSVVSAVVRNMDSSSQDASPRCGRLSCTTRGRSFRLHSPGP